MISLVDLSPYRFSELGWLQFERLCELVVEAACPGETEWIGRADRGRIAQLKPGARLAVGEVSVEGPMTVVVVWTRAWGDPARGRVLASQLKGLATEFGLVVGGRVVVMSNLTRDEVGDALAALPEEWERPIIIGGEELSASLDQDAELRAVMPSVLGIRDLGPLIPAPVAATSSFDVDRAQELARVFWSTRAYDRARAVLARHRFLVLTGPPEVGKTAIAQMLGLAQMTAGWEVHECSSPDQLWALFARGRRQLFIVDDAFGSTEYRPDGAEQWAQALGRLLEELDDDHWLIWTSRPAPLKAGLGRVRRERGSERFPAPGDVLVDASDLDLAEKTLILYRHVKARQAPSAARELVRAWGLTIVEHPHFTPERIRRLVADRLEVLADPTEVSPLHVQGLIRLELASPTDAMRTSYRALTDEHRQVLIALLDAPSGLVDERELAAILRRHQLEGLGRPVHELIDRLTDHFLRVSPLGIGWVHPSWRDLVIDELSSDPQARQRFLATAGLHGATLALSHSGGRSGERSMPLLADDDDWDRLGDALHRLVIELEDRELARVLLAVRDALTITLDPAARLEAEATATELLDVIARRCDADRTPLNVYLLEAWYSLNTIALRPAEPPSLVRTWAELHPGSPPEHQLDRVELNRLDEWLTLVETLGSNASQELRALGFFDRDQQLLPGLIAALERSADHDTRPLVEAILTRIERVAPRHYDAAVQALQTLELATPEWWTPEDIAAPPTLEIVQPGRQAFTRTDVGRVLADLD
jgi:hypothetical protein